MERYIMLLKDRGLKVTSQRLEIMKFLDEHRDHPTAESIFRALKKDNPSLSRATVYNTIELLREQGLIMAVRILGPELHYDFNSTMHHHFFCRKCKVIIDVNIKCPFLDNMLKGEHKIEAVQGNFIGVCKGCRAKDGKKVE